ncbi:hypothetical protein, partial [Acetobacter sp.]|uniref:hypothetical protein n=1 Tax=Acetobacter sp. TaxID=440 RepID=UPI0039EA168B
RKFNQKTACHYPLSFQGVANLTVRVSEGSSPAVRTTNLLKYNSKMRIWRVCGILPFVFP